MAVAITEGTLGQLSLQGEGAFGHIPQARLESRGDLCIFFVGPSNRYGLRREASFCFNENTCLIVYGLEGRFRYHNRDFNGIYCDAGSNEHAWTPVAFGVGEDYTGESRTSCFTHQWSNVRNCSTGIRYFVPYETNLVTRRPPYEPQRSGAGDTYCP